MLFLNRRQVRWGRGGRVAYRCLTFCHYSFFSMNETAIYKMINGHLIHTPHIQHTHTHSKEKKCFHQTNFQLTSVNIFRHSTSTSITSHYIKNAAEQTSCVPPLILRVCLAYYNISLHTFLCHQNNPSKRRGKKRSRRDKFSNWWFCKFAVRLKRNEIKKLLFRFSVHVFLLLCCE